MAVVVLLGSGASVAAGVPSVVRLTDAIRSGTVMYKHTNDRFYPRPEPLRSVSEAGIEVRRAVFMYRILDALSRLELARPTNYEDVYFLASQLLDHELREFENPLLRLIAEDLRVRLAASRVGVHESGEPATLQEGIAELCHYIHDAVWWRLAPVFNPASLRPFAAAVGELGAECQAIVSLNHDELARYALEEARVDFEDGFEVETSDSSRWQPSRFDTTSAVKLIHLHGSVRWFWSMPFDPPVERRTLRRFSISGPDHVKLPSGVELFPTENRPCISLGTHNKVTGYFQQPFSELYGQLTRLLRENSTVDTLVVAGYGGQDKGVNLQVSDWMQQGPDQRIVLIHPNPASFRNGARPLLRGQWAGWETRGRIKTIAKRFEEATTEELVSSVRLR